MQLATLHSSLVVRRSSLAKRLVTRTIFYLLSIICYLLSASLCEASNGTLAGDGTAASPYEIADYADLLAFASKVNGGETNAWASLAADIDASASASAQPWTPIGNDSSRYYTGTFDGRGRVITGLTFNNTSVDNVGLFGVIGSGGVVKNVRLAGGSIAGGHWVGGVAGWNGGTVANCHNTCPVSGADSVGGVTGGIVSSATVKNCSNAGDVSGAGIVGGVTGDSGRGIVAGCRNTGKVSSTGSSVGGVAGWNGGTVKNCSNAGDVSGKDNVGGVAGEITDGTVANCYNTGTVSGTGNYVGGVAGYNGSQGQGATVANCYNTGDVSSSYAGGVVGANRYTVSNACYNVAVATSVSGAIGTDFTSGANVTNVKGLGTAEMQGANALVNIGLPEDVWVATPGYPLLKAFDVTYLDPVGGTNAVCAVAIPYFGQDTLTSGWYVVTGAVTNANRIEVSGSVNLILKDGAELAANSGINVAVEGGVTNSLAIWAQSDAEAEGNNAGRLTATGSSYDAGIGGGYMVAGGNVYIYGCAVVATGADGAGIGGGYTCAGGGVYIFGGTVRASGTKGAGIGGGSGAGNYDGDNAGGNVHIHGGTVTASSKMGAGIGGGNSGGPGGNVYIYGGTVRASGTYGAGIGGGYRGGGGNVCICGGTITASSTNGTAIGGSISTVHGSLTIPDMNVYAREADMNATPDQPVAAVLRETTCHSQWAGLKACEAHDHAGDSPFCIHCGGDMHPVRYLDPVGGTNAFCPVYSLYTGENTLTSCWWAVSAVITNDTRIQVSGDANLILMDGAELVATEGIHLAAGNGLTLWAQSDSDGMGALSAMLHDDWNSDATIGGNYRESGGRITINGGRVTAELKGAGVIRGACIGGGSHGSGGTILIRGGNVTASCTGYYSTGSAYVGGSAIGGGQGGGAGEITIVGGAVTAFCASEVGDPSGHAIGPGDGSDDYGTLIFDGMKVFDSDTAATAVASTNRETACRGTYAKLAVCFPHGYEGDSCKWCGESNPLTNVTVRTEAWNPVVAVGFTLLRDVAGEAPEGAMPRLVLSAADTVSGTTNFADVAGLSADALLGSNGTCAVEWDLADAFGEGFASTGVVFTVAYRYDDGARTACALSTGLVEVRLRKSFAPTDIVLAGCTNVYDGVAHTIGVRTNAIEGLTLKYCVTDGNSQFSILNFQFRPYRSS